MSHKIYLHPKAKKELEKHRKTDKRIKKKIKQLSDHPEKIGKPLKHSDYWSLRIGKYRAIYEIKQEKVVVLWIGHRKNAYTDFKKLL